MKSLFTLLVLTGWASAQDDLRAAATSPYRLVNYINSQRWIYWNSLWTSLRPAPEDVFIPDCEEPGACSAIAVEVPSPQQVIVVVRHRFYIGTAYVRFVRSGKRWQFAGAYSPFAKYFEPEHHLLSIGGKPFLSVTEQAAAGTGLSSGIENWFDLTAPDFTPVFSFLVHGTESRVGGGIDREVHGAVASIQAGPDESIEVRWTVRFSPDWYPSIHLPVREGRAVYTRRAGQKTFAFDPEHSPTPRKEVNGLFQSFGEEYGYDDQDILRYEFDYLKQIAAGPESTQKRWLREFLAYCDDSSEKRALQSLLTPAR